jgi:hypothetical protein
MDRIGIVGIDVAGIKTVEFVTCTRVYMDVSLFRGRGFAQRWFEVKGSKATILEWTNNDDACQPNLRESDTEYVPLEDFWMSWASAPPRCTCAPPQQLQWGRYHWTLRNHF